MKKLIFTVLMGLSALSLFAKDQFVGFYEGEIKGPGAEKSPIFSKNNNIFSEVYRDKDIYRLKLQSSVLSPDIQIYSVSENLSAKGDGIDLKDSGDFKLNGKITSKKITAKGKGDDGGDIQINLKRLNIKPKTRGAKPPKGAIVLFDGKNTDKWEMFQDGAPATWDIEGDAMLVKWNVNKGLIENPKDIYEDHYDSSIRTKDAFGGPFRLHVEYMPIEPFYGEWQMRGNSGIFIDSHEVQVLDSFGDPNTSAQHAASIYARIPNPYPTSLEPDVWQTYDIEFAPATYDDNGKLQNLPTITVYHNGILVHDKVQPEQDMERQYPTQVRIMLQDHLCPLAYRNIWLLPLDK